MSSKVIIFDTSILCCLLQVPGKETCGPENDRWDFHRINRKVADENASNSIFVLPLATIIETGNHIAFASGHRFSLAQGLADLIRKTATESDPWAARKGFCSWQMTGLNSPNKGWVLVTLRSRTLQTTMHKPMP